MINTLSYLLIIYVIVKLFEFVVIRYIDRKNEQYKKEAEELQIRINEKEALLKQSPLPCYHIQMYRPTNIKEVQKITDMSHTELGKGGDGKCN